MFDSLKNKLGAFVSSITDRADNQVSTATKLKAAVSGSTKLSSDEIVDIIWNLQTDLLQSDVSLETADFISHSINKKLNEMEFGGKNISSQIREFIRQSLLEALDEAKEVDLIDLIKSSAKPFTLLLLGINGTGKTTSMAKLAKLLQGEGLSVVFAAGDTFRAGAIEQLKHHAQALDIKVISHQRGADSAAVIYDAKEHAKARHIDVVLADTAGRMQSKSNLMDELKKIIRVNQPDFKIFVADALSGNDAVEQAQSFNEICGFDGTILSKMDADAKGGAALSIINTTKKPIIYIGVGQSYHDLKKFDKTWFISKILD